MRLSALLTIPLLACHINAIAIPAPTPARDYPALVVRDTTASITPAPSPTDGYFTSTQTIIVGGFTNEYATNPGNTIEIAIQTCIQTIVPDSNGYVPPGTCGAIWAYYPNFNAAVVFAVMFAATTALHIIQAIRYKKVGS